MITSFKIYLRSFNKSHIISYLYAYSYIMYIHVICHILAESFIEYARFIMRPVAPTACQLYLYPPLHVEEGGSSAAGRDCVPLLALALCSASAPLRLALPDSLCIWAMPANDGGTIRNYRPGSVAPKSSTLLPLPTVAWLRMRKLSVCLPACLSLLMSVPLSVLLSVPLFVPLSALPLSFGRTICGMLHAAGNYRWATIGSLSRFLFKLRNVLSTICPLIYAQHCRGREKGQGDRGVV